jgi:putative ABC transport system permease protein
MFKNYLITACRNFLKNKLYSSLNILGLAIGLATCLMIVLYVQDELSYDRFHENAGRIYRVNNEAKFGDNEFNVAQTPALVGPEAVRQFPQVKQYTRLRSNGSFLVRKGESNVNEGRVGYADSTLFEVFTLPMISGDPATALKSPRSVVITESIAQKYFNRSDVAGQQLLINDTATYTITGVIKDMPHNSHFRFNFFLPFIEMERSRDNDWMSQNFTTYLLLEKNADAAKMEKEVNAMLHRYADPELKQVLGYGLDEFYKQGNYTRLTFTPVTRIHLHENRLGEMETNGNIQYVYIFSLVAFFILIIACVNFMNMYTARSSNRAKEVGVRKVLGSLRKNLVEQFLVESVLTGFISFLLAVAITWLMLPWFNELAGKEISIGVLFRPVMIGALLAATLLVGLMAGSYPAFLISALKPVEILKGKIAKGFKGSWLRNALVVFQFSISIILIIGTLVIFNQLNYIHKKDIGYNREQVLVIYNTDALKNQAATFRNELLQLNGISHATMTGFLPVNGFRSNDAYFTSPTLDAKNALSMQSWSVDEHYLPTLGIQLMAGRNFSSQFPTDSKAIIINEAAARFLGGKDLLNKKLFVLQDINTKTVEEFHIVGIIKNFNFNSLRETITPLALQMGRERASIAVRLNTTDVAPVLAQIKNKWQAMAHTQPFNYSFMDEDYDRQYSTERRTGQILISFTVLAILVACLGIFALVAYAAEQRVKEIGIRKVLGASVFSIVNLLSLNFIKLVAVALLVAFPLAWFAMNKWLEGFAYRINIGWEIFAAAGIMALLIAGITVSFQAVKAALANPVKSLKSNN